MKKIITKIIPLLFIVLIMTACGQRDLPTDKPLDDGGLFYRNNTLKFSLILPSSFDKYQTQRIAGDKYIDLEIFVPTSDERFGKQVKGYAKPVVIRVFEEEAWRNINQENSIYKFLGDKKDKVYTILFWEKEPNDWQGKWHGEVENSVINSFEVE